MDNVKQCNGYDALCFHRSKRWCPCLNVTPDAACFQHEILGTHNCKIIQGCDVLSFHADPEVGAKV